MFDLAPHLDLHPTLPAAYPNPRLQRGLIKQIPRLLGPGSEAQCGRHGHKPVDAVSDSAGLLGNPSIRPQKRRGGSKNEIDACHEGRGQGEADKISVTGLAEYPPYLGSWHARDEKGVVGICLVRKAYHMMVLAGVV